MPRETNKQKVYRIAQELGVEVVEYRDNETGRLEEITIEAPEGRLWSTSGDIHELVSSRADIEPASDMWKDLAERMSDGVELCEIPECEWCNGY